MERFISSIFSSTCMDVAIREIITKAKKDSSVVAVALYGSYARGEKYRDIDICIFLKPKEYPDLALSQKRMMYLSEKEGYDVQIFQQLPVYIQRRILKDVKVIYCKDEDTLYDLSFQSVRDFDHFQHIYEGYLDAVENG